MQEKQANLLQVYFTSGHMTFKQPDAVKVHSKIRSLLVMRLSTNHIMH